jgi:hypothetical protein
MFGRKQFLAISTAAYQEITAKLIEQSIDFKVTDGAIDLTGIAVVQEQAQEEAPAPAAGIGGHRPLSNVTVKIPRKGAE